MTFSWKIEKCEKCENVSFFSQQFMENSLIWNTFAESLTFESSVGCLLSDVLVQKRSVNAFHTFVWFAAVSQNRANPLKMPCPLFEVGKICPKETKHKFEEKK